MFKAKKVTVPLQITIFIVHTFYITALVSMQKTLMKLCLMLQSTCTLNGAQYEPLIIQFTVSFKHSTYSGVVMLDEL